jgi:hypothetical protein
MIEAIKRLFWLEVLAVTLALVFGKLALALPLHF